MATVAELRALARAVRQRDRISSLEAKLDEYWQTFDPLFDWTPVEKICQSASFLRREVRAAARSGAGDRAGDRGAEQRQPRRPARRGHAPAGGVPRRPAAAALAEACSSASSSRSTVVIRLRVLERRSDEQRAVAEEAERQMRQLSQRLVATQEEERKNLSRELHDHVAQVLTALRMETRAGIETHRRLGEPTSRAELMRRRPLVRGRRRMPAARRQDVPHGPRSRARSPAEHARRLRPAAGARMARARLQPPVRRRRRADASTATSTSCRTATGRASIERSRRR